MTETTPNSHGKRSLRNLPLLPSNNLRTCFVLCAITSLFAGALALVALVTATKLKLVIPDFDTTILNVLSGCITLSLSSSLLCLAFAAIVSHRVYGPIVAIKRQLASMEAGDFSARGTLRDGDEFTELMTSLNRIAESIQNGKK